MRKIRLHRYLYFKKEIFTSEKKNFIVFIKRLRSNNCTIRLSKTYISLQNTLHTVKQNHDNYIWVDSFQIFLATVFNLFNECKISTGFCNGGKLVLEVSGHRDLVPAEGKPVRIETVVIVVYSIKGILN